MNVHRTVAPLVTLIALAGFPAQAGTLVNPSGTVQALVADPVRNVFYLSTSTPEVVAVDTSGAVTRRATLSESPRGLAIAPDGSEIYVALPTSHDVAVYTLPDLTYRTTWAPTLTTGPAIVAKAGRLYAMGNATVSIFDTATGTEVFAGTASGGPANFAFTASTLELSPDGQRLYAMQGTISPVSLLAFDVANDAPLYVGQECCASCLGSNGRQVVAGADGRLYVATGSVGALQVLSSVPPFRHLFGPPVLPPNAIAIDPNRDRIYLGSGADTSSFTVVRPSDWLPFYVGALQGAVADRGLALSADGTTLAAVIAFGGFTPNRLELVSVGGTLAPNRGAIKGRLLDDVAGIVAGEAALNSSAPAGAMLDEDAGVWGSGPHTAGTKTWTTQSAVHTMRSGSTSVTAGAWTDLGDLTLVRTGTLPTPSRMCVVPAAILGESHAATVYGRGFVPGVAVSTVDPTLLVSAAQWASSSSVTLTLSALPSAPTGYQRYVLRALNPGAAQSGSGHLLVAHGWFANDFETGTLYPWSLTEPPTFLAAPKP